MLDEVLSLLKNKLNSYFKLITFSPEDKVTFLDGSRMDPPSFALNCVTPLLVNIEEEKILRQANRYEGIIKSGIKIDYHPSIGINAMVLFVSRFSDYEQSLKFLSLVISYFQKFPLLDRYNTPELPPSVEKIRVELVTLPISQQNEIWSAFRTAYVPSVVYKIGVLLFKDNTSMEVSSEIQYTELTTTSL